MYERLHDASSTLSTRTVLSYASISKRIPRRIQQLHHLPILGRQAPLRRLKLQHTLA